MAIPEPPSSPPPPLVDEPETSPSDPPPPYPSGERRIRPSRNTHRGAHARPHTDIPSSSHHHHHHYSQSTSSSSYLDSDSRWSRYTDDESEPSETTPICPRHHHHSLGGRPRALSHTSTTSSVAHTMLSIFQTEDYDDSSEDSPRISLGDNNVSSRPSPHQGTGFFSVTAWRRYFRPLVMKTYYKALFHLLVLNFTYALVAWVYLFVFTVTGTILLIALPLGAVLCFFDLLGARAFSRGELALQSRFHGPLAHTLPYPPRPIFTRYRPLTPDEVESGRFYDARHLLVAERSFYKNTYAMFTDPTSYQALFYFIVVKPAITLLISVGVIVFALPAMILVVPAPAMLRAVRRVGIWQANIAIEGLYVPVR